ncbi:MAG TPA: peptide ABC transporter substrate-binding protein [Gemmatimonadaceae bacterium]|nr:peptide ABC transporter substrate-binding protein [Gemmatimonadaceae bacterium]
MLRRCALLALALSACQARDTGVPTTGRAGGTVVFAAPATGEPLFPPVVNSNATLEIVDQLFESLAKLDGVNPIGDTHMVPVLADKWQWSPDSLSIAFHIDPHARWHDGVPVTATDVRYSFRTYTDTVVGAASATYLTAIDSVTAPDSATAVFWFKHRYPYQFYDAAAIMYIVPAHLLATIAPTDLRAAPFGHHPVGTGRFRFVSWTPGQELTLTADTANYHGRPLLDNLVWLVAPDPQTAMVKLYAGDADVYEVVPPDARADVASHRALRLKPYTDGTYGFLGFNLRRPLFATRPLRRALTMGLDRHAMLRNVFDTLGRIPPGPVVHWHFLADTTLRQLPYDTTAAGRTLDSLGWRRGPDGMRRNGGRPLTFSILVPTSSKIRMRYAVLIQEQLHGLGVTATVDAVEFGAYLQRLASHQFDAFLNTWALDPSPGAIKETWTSSAIPTGFNYSAYSNPVFDALVDSGTTSADLPRVRAYFSRAFQVINDDAPGAWLYEPGLVAAVNARVHSGPLPAQHWWLDLADWSIPAAQRIPRDRIGVQPPPH